MTVAELSLVLTGGAAMVSALTGVAAVVIGVINGRHIKIVRKEANGMKDDLVAEVRAASLAKGHKEGVAEALGK